MQVTAYAHNQKSFMKTLPKLLEKVYDSGLRAVIKTSEEMREAVDSQLWTYTPLAFLPHGSSRTGMAEHQPLWITDKFENPNGSQVLVLVDVDVDGVPDILGFERVLDLYSENDPQSVTRFQKRKDTYDASKYSLTVWSDSPMGSWEKKEN